MMTALRLIIGVKIKLVLVLKKFSPYHSQSVLTNSSLKILLFINVTFLYPHNNISFLQFFTHISTITAILKGVV